MFQPYVLLGMEEVWHKEGKHIGFVISLNNSVIAIFTCELKCNTSVQNYDDATR